MIDHKSDCAIHNAPALDPRACDCGLIEFRVGVVEHIPPEASAKADLGAIDLKEIQRRRTMFDGQLNTKDIGNLIAEVEALRARLAELEALKLETWQMQNKWMEATERAEAAEARLEKLLDPKKDNT